MGAVRPGGEDIEVIKMLASQDAALVAQPGNKQAGAAGREETAPTREADGQPLFRALLDEALSEVIRREPSYFARFALALPPLGAQARHYARHPLFDGCRDAAIEAALSSGIDVLRERGVRVGEADGEADPVALLLCDSIADAFAASTGRLGLSAGAGLAAADAVSAACTERWTASSRRYFMGGARSAAGRPLVLINACGMPLSLWSGLIGDTSHPWPLIAAESPCTDPIRGGMRAAVPLSGDSSVIALALDDARVDRADLLAWCNGARIAIEFAGRFPDRVRSLILVSPTLRGAAGATPAGSAFEDDLNRIFVMVDARPHLAKAFADAFRSRFECTAWGKLANHPEQRAATLLGLPARERVSALVAPMVQPDFLVNYGRRVLRDQQYPIHTALRGLKSPVLLVTGDYDDRVNNAFTCAVLRAWGVRFLHAQIKGAGHYLYDLQYQYFRLILSAFLAGRPPPPAARIEMQEATA